MSSETPFFDVTLAPTFYSPETDFQGLGVGFQGQGLFCDPLPLTTQDVFDQTSLQNAYLTPPICSAGEFAPMTDFLRPTEPTTSYGSYFMPLPDNVLPTRPHSSPSTFGPSADELVWAGNPLKTPLQESVPNWGSTFPPPKLSAPRHRPNRSVTEIHAPQPKRPYAAIAPHPAGIDNLNALQPGSDGDDTAEWLPRKRKRSSPPLPPPATSEQQLGDEDRLLLRLKDEEGLSWKDIAARFYTERGKSYQVPALQMRLKRLRERLRVWTNAEVNALRMAHEYWEKNKFEIISAKMLEYGVTEKWPAKQCARKWQELSVGPDMYASSVAQTPSFSYESSPVEGPGTGFLPFLSIPP